MIGKFGSALALIALGIGAAFGFAQQEPAARAAAAHASAAAPVVLELFTSQGCSSCPPADRVAAQLARGGAVIVISRPVTYWDRLGWRDTLAMPANTELQRAYAPAG